MRPDELVFAVRVEETHPTDRVRGTVVNIDPSGLFVVKYDNGDYLAFHPEQLEAFHTIPEKPIPSHAMETIKALYRQHGRTPPQDVMKKNIPGQARSRDTASSNPALTTQAEPPSIEA